MEIGFSIIGFMLVILFYLSNPKNRINQWCAISCFFFWVGIAKEVVLYDLIPMLHSAFGTTGLDIRFAPVHSVCTWMIYTFAMPTMLLAGAYFSGIDQKNPRYMRLLLQLIFVPGLILSFIFYPARFRYYQLNSLSFWIIYTTLNFGFGIALAVVTIKGLAAEEPGKAKNQKRRVAAVMLPPLYYWLITIFIPHLLGIEDLFSLWKTNFFLLLICIIIFIYLAFKDGFMGLRLFGMKYDWDKDMSIISASVEFTSHMFKNQAAKMDICIDQLIAAWASTDSAEDIPEELAILSRSVTALKTYVDRIQRHSQAIYLQEAQNRLKDMLISAISETSTNNANVEINIHVDNNVFLICDKVHITEVFVNILSNAVDALGGGGIVDISGNRKRSGYRLYIKDDGIGIESAIMKKIFTPHFTTKNTEKNYGLGLSYCKNVITKHNGRISVKSDPGKGTTVLISFPARKVIVQDFEENNYG